MVVCSAFGQQMQWHWRNSIISDLAQFFKILVCLRKNAEFVCLRRHDGNTQLSVCVKELLVVEGPPQNKARRFQLLHALLCVWDAPVPFIEVTVIAKHSFASCLEDAACPTSFSSLFKQHCEQVYR